MIGFHEDPSQRVVPRPPLDIWYLINVIILDGEKPLVEYLCKGGHSIYLNRKSQPISRDDAFNDLYRQAIR